MRDKLSKLKYRRKLVIYFLVFTMIPLAAFYSYFFYITFNGKVKEILSSTDAMISGSTDSLANMYQQNLQKLNMMDKNYLLQNYLNSDEDIEFSQSMMDFFYNLDSIYHAIKDDSPNWRLAIYLMNEKVLPGSFIRSIDQLDVKTKEEVLGALDKTYIWKYRETNDRGATGGFICIYKVNMSKDSSPIAIEEIVIGFNQIKSNFQHEIPEGSMILYLFGGTQPITIKNNGIDADRESFIAASCLNGDINPLYRDYHLVESSLGYNNDRILALIPKTYVYEKLLAFITILTAGFIGLALLIVFLISFASRLLTQRLYTLISELNQDLPKLIESGELELFKGEDEFAKINTKFKELVNEIKEYYRKDGIAQTEKKALELELLQSLINPHFLYNTLDGIKWTYRDPRLSDIIDSMVRYYRIALNKGNKVLKVSQEMDMVEQYLKLQKFAYESDFRYRIEIDVEILDCKIIKHLLQPIVENAVLHGIKKQDPDELITVTGRLKGHTIVFEISDNGVGMDQEKAEQILRGEYKTVQGGYGLSNVQKRIEIYYGREYGVNIVSREGEGTSVTVRIPAVPGGEKTLLTAVK